MWRKRFDRLRRSTMMADRAATAALEARLLSLLARVDRRRSATSEFQKPRSIRALRVLSMSQTELSKRTAISKQSSG
jgi:hypothetical protein